MMNLELYSPEEISGMLRGKISAWSIRKLARESKIEHVRVDRGKILFTQAQVQAFLQAHTQRVVAAPVPANAGGLGFQGTSRSRKARAKAGLG